MTYDVPPTSPGWALFRVGQGLLIEDGKVLLTGNRWFTGKPLVWTLPGGRADEGEGIQEAAVREFREETGLTVEVQGLAYVVEAQSTVRRQTYLTCVFLVRRLRGKLSCDGDPGVEELGFFSPEEIAAQITSHSIGEPLLAYLQHPDEAPRYRFYPEYLAEQL